MSARPHRIRQRSPVLGLLGVLVTFAAIAAIAAPGPVLHEPLPPARGAPTRSGDRIVPGADGRAAAIETSAGTIPRPPPARPGDDTPRYKPEPPPRVGIDRKTGADLELHYQVVFDPAIAPFKREIAFDTVHSDVTLAVSGRGLRPLPPGPLPARVGHELFWGHARIALEPGQRSLLPSVAPTSQILEWQAVPPLPLTFWRDDAGNFSVGLTAPKANAPPQLPTEVDLRFLVDAPSDYFGAALGSRSRRDDPEAPLLDPALQARAQALWKPLQVTARMDRGEQLTRLAQWFRNFTPGAPPAQGEDPVADLVLSQKGVCRHRALGFIVVAHSLGIPSHYVMNDAHAFLEVWAPRADGHGGWLRLDLGGGAESLELHSAGQKRLHQPAFRDPFPRPPNYANQVGQVTAAGQPIEHTWAGADKLKGAGGLTTGGRPRMGAGGTAENGPAFTVDPNHADRVQARRKAWLLDRAKRLAAPLEPPPFGAAARALPADPRKVTALTLRAAPMAWVGETLEVMGTLTAAGGRASRQPVELWLIDPAHPLQGQLVGMGVTDARGQFRLQLGIPTEADLRVYDLVARFGGDGGQRPSDTSEQ